MMKNAVNSSVDRERESGGQGAALDDDGESDDVGFDNPLQHITSFFGPPLPQNPKQNDFYP